MKISLRGKALLFDPRWNKGTAFSADERAKFGLSGLLPPHVSTIEEQIRRRYENFLKKSEPIDKYEFLIHLQNRNEVLFYRLVLEHVNEMLPYVYTPTVGDASLGFSVQYHESRGVFISISDENKIQDLLKNAGKEDVDVVVVTDGERILGLGDVGIGGMVIPIGKSSLYTLFGGVRPERILAVFLDVGTNNENLLKDPNYIGYREHRVTGNTYDLFIDKFIQGVKNVFPNAILQWEDFSKEHATALLERYQSQLPSFNDDIQGTASVVLAGLISAMRQKEKKLGDEKIAIFGAGSAGLGIANLIVDYLYYKGVSKETAFSNIYLIDKEGLVHEGLFGKPQKLKTLIDVINFAKITTLIGTSAQPSVFNEAVVKAMLAFTDQPVIFPLSNPNSKSEGDPKEIYQWTKGKAIIATGSPYPNTPQCNNVYIFPSFGLLASVVRLKEIPNKLFIIAAEALSDFSNGKLFPEFKDLRKVTKMITEKLLNYVIQNQLNETEPKILSEKMWFPEYENYV
jgi:malate dehydrogenase (oxaloacetate-decarboxylating)